MQYESSIPSGLKDVAKVFVHATDTDADGRLYDISSPYICPGSLITV